MNTTLITLRYLPTLQPSIEEEYARRLEANAWNKSIIAYLMGTRLAHDLAASLLHEVAEIWMDQGRVLRAAALHGRAITHDVIAGSLPEDPVS